MCGIAGFIGKGDYGTGKKMIESIRYRGPDFQDVFFSENVCLAHARLSIIDLSATANQPMFSDDKKCCIVFNGEIYNFPSLKKELIENSGETFHTNSDTEVLLHLYQRYGRKMTDKIQGMFVFAIYDFGKKELFIAKDRMGKKPLYYTSCSDGTFVFASELKSVLQHPSVKKEINLESINQYLTFDYIPAPGSLITNIHKLEAANYLVFRDGKIHEKSNYWEVPFSNKSNLSFNQSMEKLDHLLNEATRSRMISDVPLGVFLSGGLDSSTVAYYAQKNSTKKINTYSIGFEDKSYDEQDYAELVSKHLGTQHHLSILTAKKTLSLIDEIFPLMDEPFADASIIPTYYLSQFTRKDVTVALGGDGSDELLAGYPTFISEKFKFPGTILPSFLIKGLLNAVNLLPASDKNISFDFKVKQYLRGFISDKNHIHQLWLGSFLPEEKKNLFKPEIFNQLKDPTGLGLIDFHFDKARDLQSFDKITNYYLQTYLPDDILVKVDRASMYNSLEVRAPFLDTELVEFLVSLPDSYKQKGLQGKYILKKLMEDKLPDSIVHRPKKGFGIPLSDWIRKDLKKNIEETLRNKDSWFQPSYIEKILKEHQTGKYNHRKLIWNLYVLKIIATKYE